MYVFIHYFKFTHGHTHTRIYAYVYVSVYILVLVVATIIHIRGIADILISIFALISQVEDEMVTCIDLTDRKCLAADILHTCGLFIDIKSLSTC